MFIVMEFVDGQTLQEKKSSFTQKQAIDIGIQIAEGLAAAHEKGIVHRDIKPENIMIRKDGIVQVMDFGLAKLAGGSRLTKMGSTVGTLGYMSPEQVQGQETDHRSDIFSFGVLLYEMLTGKSPFNGAHESAILYEIVNVDVPPMSSIKPEIDAELDRIVLECMEKDPNERMQSIKQVAIDLNRFKRTSSRTRMSRTFSTSSTPKASKESNDHSDPGTASGRSFLGMYRLPWIVAGVCFLGLLVLTGVHFWQEKPQSPTITASILPPDGWKYFNDYDGGHIALSPDGSMLAFVASDSSSKTALWVQSIQTGVTQRLAGTEGATYPFWSPDNRSIAFFAEGSLKKILAGGGPATILCAAAAGRGGTWNAEEVILFSPMYDQTGIFRVSASGGEAIPVTHVDTTRNESNHRWPLFLPDGKHFVYASQAYNKAGGEYLGAMYVAALDSSVNKLLVKVSSNVAYVNGHLLYVRQGVIVAQTFDLNSLTLSGDAIPISGNIEYSSDKNRGVFSCSQNGILLYQPGQVTNVQRKILWIDRNGKRRSLSENVLATFSARLSPDGKRIVYDTYDNQFKTNDIWIYDINRGLSSRMTFEKSDDFNPLWSPDGKQIVFSSDQHGQLALFIKNSNGTEAEQSLFESKEALLASDWSSDGKYLMFQHFSTHSGGDLGFLPMKGDRKPVPFLQESYEEGPAVFSSDGRWVAYESGESGARNEIFVRPFPLGSGKWQISTNGGRFARWRHDGREIYYRASDGTIFAVEVNGTGSTFVIGRSVPLFKISRSEDPQVYDVTPDGQRFIIGVIPEGVTPSNLKIVTNWDAEVKKK